MSYRQYEPPKAAVDDIPIDNDSVIQLERIASAQKWVINAIVVYLSAVILRVALHPLLVLLAIPAFIAGIIGVLQFICCPGSFHPYQSSIGDSIICSSD